MFKWGTNWLSHPLLTAHWWIEQVLNVESITRVRTASQIAFLSTKLTSGSRQIEISQDGLIIPQDSRVFPQILLQTSDLSPAQSKTFIFFCCCSCCCHNFFSHEFYHIYCSWITVDESFLNLFYSRTLH